MEPRLQSLGPLPWLFSYKWQAGGLPPCRSGGQRGAGVLDPGCLAQAHTGQGPYRKHKRFLGPLSGCLNLFWQARRRHAVSPATGPSPQGATQADYRGANA